MDVRIDSETLGRELDLLAKVVARKPTLPVLNNVLLRADGPGVLRLAATDLDVGLGGPCVASVERPGTMTLPALKLAEIVRALPGTEIRLTLDGAAARLTGGKYKSRLQAMPAEDFPAPPEMNGAAALTLPRAPLRRLLRQTRPAVSDAGDNRFFLAGALLKWDGDQLLMVGTDSHRLAVAAEPFAVPVPGEALVPAKALAELAALLDEEGTGDVAFAASENHLFFALDGRVLFSRLIDGKFPAWERIVPKANDRQLVVDRAMLLTALRRVDLISSGTSRSVLFTLARGELRLSAISAELGDADEQLAAEYQGPACEVRIQGQFVADFLEAARGATVTMAVKDEVSQVLWTDGEPGYRYVAMPMRI